MTISLRDTPLLYAIRAPRLGCVKIGVTTNIIKRFKAFQSHCPEPLQLVCAVPTHLVDEKRVHADCVNARLRLNMQLTEWFQLDNDRVQFWLHHMIPLCVFAAHIDKTQHLLTEPWYASRRSHDPNTRTADPVDPNRKPVGVASDESLVWDREAGVEPLGP